MLLWTVVLLRRPNSPILSQGEPRPRELAGSARTSSVYLPGIVPWRRRRCGARWHSEFPRRYLNACILPGGIGRANDSVVAVS
jgi:hypothetical protein